MNEHFRVRDPIHQGASVAAVRTVPRFSYEWMAPVVAISEVGIIIAASVVAGLAYHRVAYGAVGGLDDLVGVGAVAAVLHVFIAKTWGLYGVPVLLGIDRRRSRLVLGWLLGFLLVTLFLFLLKMGAGVSRGSTIMFGGLGLAGIVGVRAVSARYLSAALERGAVTGRRAVVLGERAELTVMAPTDLLRRFGIREVGRVTLRDVEGHTVATDRTDLTAVNEAIDLARRVDADEVVLALNWSAVRRLDLVRDRLRMSPLPVRLLPDQRVGQILKQPITNIGPAISVEIQRGPLTRAEQVQKRVLDVVLSSLALLTLSPLMLATAVAIKVESPGPLIFKQRRKGFNGRQFTIFKFRSMRVLEDGPVVEQAKKVDPRVTRVGWVIRRTSIDELPQLFNVLRGEMSLVGPRPHAMAHDDKYVDMIANYAFRHHMKPGITGWAQVNGCRGETARIEQMQDRVERDLWYINNWSLWLDFRVLVRTSFEVIGNPKAY